MPELLNLNDMKFNIANYKSHGKGLREWLIASFDYFSISIYGLSELTNIKYRTLLNFVNNKTSYMSYSNMNKLRIYLEGLIEDEKAKNYIHSDNIDIDA